MAQNSNEVVMRSVRPQVDPVNTPTQLQNKIQNIQNGPRNSNEPFISGSVGEQDASQEDLAVKALKERLGKSYASLRDKLKNYEAQHIQGPSGLDDMYRVVKSATNALQILLTSRSINNTQVLQQNLNSSDPDVKKRAFEDASSQFRREDNAQFYRQQGEALAGSVGASVLEGCRRLWDMFSNSNATKDNALNAPGSTNANEQQEPTAGPRV